MDEIVPVISVESVAGCNPHKAMRILEDLGNQVSRQAIIGCQVVDFIG
jgi:hypothetical protein